MGDRVEVDASAVGPAMRERTGPFGLETLLASLATGRAVALVFSEADELAADAAGLLPIYVRRDR